MSQSLRKLLPNHSPAVLFSVFFAAAPLVALQPVPAFPLASSPLNISRAAETTKPFSVAGEHGAIFGQQGGVFESWVFPIKVLDDLHLTAELADYPVPIDVNAYSAHIDVQPSHTTITYSHAAFTIRQHMFVGRGAGPVVLFEIHSLRPMQLTVRFTPQMLRMWPAPNYGRPGAEWVQRDTSGFYILHTDDPGFSGAVAMPRAEPGILPPYQERPKTYPLEFRVKFDPRRDDKLFFPLLVASGSTSEELERSLDLQNQQVRTTYDTMAAYWQHFFDTRLTADTPDPKFDLALKWAAVAIDQSRVKFHDETGMIAGYYSSGDSARPGFGWFFGRDTMFTLYAVHSYGDFDLSRTALEFLIHRQREDGKIMHEYSQTADLVNWKALPYFYAAADSTPLFLMILDDYVRSSGDVAFLRRHWDVAKKAYAFLRAHDSDGDGIYENTEGTGWVEGWPPKMPHQEIYLAALDWQATGAMARLAKLMGDTTVVANAAKIGAVIEKEYYDPASSFYAFSRNPDGSIDKTATIFPALAWWDGTASLSNAGPMLDRWASHEFSTDWGTRDVSPRSPLYDPLSYHQGSVWPLFTGWVSLAEYRAGRAVSAYAHLMQNADLTYAQDLGAVTELLSGEFYQPFGRSSSHQTWSSAMVLTPAVRGLFGVTVDAARKRINLAPHLPATWEHAMLHHVPIGVARVDLEFKREGTQLRIRTAADVELCAAGKCATNEISLTLPVVEFEIPHALPTPGAQTGGLKAINDTGTFEAPAGTTWTIQVRRDGKLAKEQLHIPQGEGYQHLTVQ